MKKLLFIISVSALFCSCASQSTLMEKKPIRYSYYYESGLYNFYKKCDYVATIKDMNVFVSHADGNKIISAYAIKATSEGLIGQDLLAIEDFKRALLINKGRKVLYDSDKDKVLISLSDIYFNMSMSYLAINDNYNAMRAISKAICLNGKDKSYYVLREQILENMGILSTIGH